MNPMPRRPSAPSGRFRAARMTLAAAGAAALLSLSGCYYYPAYGYDAAPGYYATAPAVVAAPAYPAYYPAYPAYTYPSVSVGFGGFWGGGRWHR